MLVAGLQVGNAHVTAWVAELDRPGVLAEATSPLAVLFPTPSRAEVDPAALEQTCRTALTQVVERAGRPPVDYLGVTVSTTRQGFVLVDGAGTSLGNGVLQADRRGAPYVKVLEGRYGLTGHWPAPDLALPKLLAVQAEEPERWAATARVLSLHDWLVWRMCGQQVAEGSYACAGGMADVAGRAWATDLLSEVGIAASQLAPWVEAGSVVGELGDGWGVPATLPVVAGSGDVQLFAMSAGGLSDGVLTVIAGTHTHLQAATSSPVTDPMARPWVSTHAHRQLWAAEGCAGSPGSAQGWWQGLMPGPVGEVPTEPSDLVAVTSALHWSRETCEHPPPVSLVGLRGDTTEREVRSALAQAHAFSVRGNIEDLERAMRRRVTAVVVTGSGARDGVLPGLLAAVLERDINWHAEDSSSAAAGTVLVAKALGAHAHAPGLPDRVIPAGDAAIWQPAFDRWVATTSMLTRGLG